MRVLVPALLARLALRSRSGANSERVPSFWAELAHRRAGYTRLDPVRAGTARGALVRRVDARGDAVRPFVAVTAAGERAHSRSAVSILSFRTKRAGGGALRVLIPPPLARLALRSRRGAHR